MRWFFKYDVVLEMSLNDMADLLEANGDWDNFSKEFGIARDDGLFVEDWDTDLDKEVWFVRFRDGNDFFMAYGPDPMYMPVYRRGDRVYHRKTNMRFPSCTKFMPYATFDDISKVTPRRGYASVMEGRLASSSTTLDFWVSIRRRPAEGGGGRVRFPYGATMRGPPTRPRRFSWGPAAPIPPLLSIPAPMVS